jgi:uncharacterized protein YabN with tetrapyrrole methylase and pyrophosphatase domain
MAGGSLVVVGVGLTFVSHLTAEARGWIERADRVFLVLGDPAMTEWIGELNPGSSVLRLYHEPALGGASARDWQVQVDTALEQVLAPARAGLTVCLVLDGHPAVMVPPAHELVRRAAAEGISAALLPGISAEDCLFADLGVDPARDGCQSYEATDFLIRRRTFSPASGLVLRQIGLIGELMLMGRFNRTGLMVLRDVLLESYRPDHETVVYEAAPFPVGGASIQRVPLAELDRAEISDRSTLYLPPATRAPVDPAMLDRLGIPPARVRD